MNYRAKLEPGFQKIEDYGFNSAGQVEHSGFMDQIQRPMETVLMVAEKPSIAKTIANALAGGRFLTRKGDSKYCPVHEFEGTLFGAAVNIRVTSVTGHIFTRDFEAQYADWYKTDPQTLFDVTTIKREVGFTTVNNFFDCQKLRALILQANPENSLVSHLQNEASDCTYLVLWLDCDREGENICFEIIDVLERHLVKKSFQQIFRAKFSSITNSDIIRSYQNLRDSPNENESKSVDARQIIDLKVGVAFSRFQSLYLKKTFQNLNQKMVTFGPCQTPTLGFCVQRSDEIEFFNSVLYYKVNIECLSEAGESTTIWRDGDKIDTKEQADEILMELSTIGKAVVQSVVKKEGFRGRPEGLNTVELLKHSSQKLNLGPQEAMNVAEKLYLGGWITYPRTETTSYAPSFNLEEIVENLARSGNSFSDYSAYLLQNGLNNPKKGTNAGDHPPITPTNNTPNMSRMPSSEARMYEFVCRHFLASISPDAKFAKTKVILVSGNQSMNLNGSMVLDPGFTDVTPWVKLSDKIIPNFVEGQEVQFSRLEIQEQVTKPAEHLTESELISLMEKNNIGTDASMATHIHNIVERGYVEVVSQRRKLVPTALGIALIRGYQAIDTELVSPELRSNIEMNVSLIAEGKTDFQTVLDSVIEIFKQKFVWFKNNIGKMELHFRKVFGTFSDAIKAGIPFSRCGKCSDQMVLVPDFHKIHCRNCKLTFNLPRDSTYSLVGEDYCPLDGFQIINYYLPRPQKETNLKVCPQCYHRSPYPNHSQRIICSQCPNSKCSFSTANTSIRKCARCKTGDMILNSEINSQFYMTCNNNKCNHTVVLVENVLNASVANVGCQQCNSKQLTIESLGSPKITTCVFCDPNFNYAVRQVDIGRKNGHSNEHHGNSHNGQQGNQRGNPNGMNRRSDAMDMKRRVNQRARGANNTRGPRFNRDNQTIEEQDNNSFGRRRGMGSFNQGGRRAFHDLRNPGGFTNRDNMMFQQNFEQNSLKQKSGFERQSQRFPAKIEENTSRQYAQDQSIYSQMNQVQRTRIQHQFNSDQIPTYHPRNDQFYGQGPEQNRQNYSKPRQEKIEPKYEADFMPNPNKRPYQVQQSQSGHYQREFSADFKDSNFFQLNTYREQHFQLENFIPSFTQDKGNSPQLNFDKTTLVDQKQFSKLCPAIISSNLCSRGFFPIK